MLVEQSDVSFQPDNLVRDIINASGVNAWELQEELDKIDSFTCESFDSMPAALGAPCL